MTRAHISLKSYLKLGNLCLTDVTSAGAQESIHLELFPDCLPCASHVLVVEDTDK